MGKTRNTPKTNVAAGDDKTPAQVQGHYAGIQKASTAAVVKAARSTKGLEQIASSAGLPEKHVGLHATITPPTGPSEHEGCAHAGEGSNTGKTSAEDDVIVDAGISGAIAQSENPLHELNWG